MSDHWTRLWTGSLDWTAGLTYQLIFFVSHDLHPIRWSCWLSFLCILKLSPPPVDSFQGPRPACVFTTKLGNGLGMRLVFQAKILHQYMGKGLFIFVVTAKPLEYKLK